MSGDHVGHRDHTLVIHPVQLRRSPLRRMWSLGRAFRTQLCGGENNMIKRCDNKTRHVVRWDGGVVAATGAFISTACCFASSLPARTCSLRLTALPVIYYFLISAAKPCFMSLTHVRSRKMTSADFCIQLISWRIRRKMLTSCYSRLVARGRIAPVP